MLRPFFIFGTKNEDLIRNNIRMIRNNITSNR